MAKDDFKSLLEAALQGDVLAGNAIVGNTVGGDGIRKGKRKAAPMPDLVKSPKNVTVMQKDVGDFFKLLDAMPDVGPKK